MGNCRRCNQTDVRDPALLVRFRLKHPNVHNYSNHCYRNCRIAVRYLVPGSVNETTLITLGITTSVRQFVSRGH